MRSIGAAFELENFLPFGQQLYCRNLLSRGIAVKNTNNRLMRKLGSVPILTKALYKKLLVRLHGSFARALGLRGRLGKGPIFGLCEKTLTA